MINMRVEQKGNNNNKLFNGRWLIDICEQGITSRLVKKQLGKLMQGINDSKDKFTLARAIRLLKDGIMPMMFQRVELCPWVLVSLKEREPANSTFGYTDERSAERSVLKSVFNANVRAMSLLLLRSHRFKSGEEIIHARLC